MIPYMGGYKVNDVYCGEEPKHPLMYDDYINSDEWKDKSGFFKFKKGNKCELCGETKNLETHHKIYPKSFEDDKEEYWQVVCEKCHDIVPMGVSI